MNCQGPAAWIGYATDGSDALSGTHAYQICFATVAHPVFCGLRSLSADRLPLSAWRAAAELLERPPMAVCPPDSVLALGALTLILQTNPIGSSSCRPESTGIVG
jgi:hypothetical protein